MGQGGQSVRLGRTCRQTLNFYHFENDPVIRPGRFFVEIIVVDKAVFLL